LLNQADFFLDLATFVGDEEKIHFYKFESNVSIVIYNARTVNTLIWSSSSAFDRKGMSS
jgi:hypothetical protein